MKISKADVILHPVRIRIIQTLIGGRKLTVQQIGERLEDIPQATLYRHLKKLQDANIIEVVEQRQVRGAVERIYALPAEEGASLSAEDLATWGKEEHMDAFMKFMSTVLADFERYVDQPNFDLQKDGAGYRQVSFYATDEEYKEFVIHLGELVKKLLANEADSGRRKRTMTTIVTAENEKQKKE